MDGILELTPHWAQKVWGGSKLEHLKGITSTVTPWGESFEVSVLAGQESLVSGNLLTTICSESKIPYLVKFIDTAENLSIQVHPDDDYAQKYENSKGKTECWVILTANEGAGIYLGFKSGVDKNSFFSSVKSGADITSFLNFIPVKKGDFFYIPAGAIHAIGKDITLLEVQQSSGITYRVWDWNRSGLEGDKRELHIEQSFDVLDFSDQFQKVIESSIGNDIFDQSESILLTTDDFKMRSISLKSGEIFNLMTNTFDRFSSVIVINGSLIASSMAMKEYTSYLFTENGSVKIEAQEKSTFILVE